VLFLYEPYDELVLMQLGQFDRKYLKSIENEVQESKEDTDTVDEKDPQSLNQSDADGLMSWLQVLLTNKVQKIKVLYIYISQSN
jgi:TNF receptor-associated protein 1